MTNITVNEAPKEPIDAGGGSSFKGFSKQESDSITTVGLGLGAIVGGYLLLNYLDAQGFITQMLNAVGITSTTVPAGTASTTPGGTDAIITGSDYAKAYGTHAQLQAQQQHQYRLQRPIITDFAKYSPDLTDISGDVEYKLHSDDSNLGAIEDPDDQYYYENASFSPGRNAAYTATIEHDPRSDIEQSYLGQDDGVLSYESETVEDDGNISNAYVGEEYVPADLSKYRVERDNLGNLLDVSVDA